jgi:hypothetical protein
LRLSLGLHRPVALLLRLLPLGRLGVASSLGENLGSRPSGLSKWSVILDLTD